MHEGQFRNQESSLSTMCVIGLELRSAQVLAGGLDPPSQIVIVS